jgi:uncharacterized protein YjiS (DUF1127 family)
MFSAMRMTQHPAQKTPLKAPPRAGGFLRWLMALDASYRDRQKLQALNDSMRRDIGLSEAQIAQELAKPVWNAPHHWLR